MNRIYLDTLAGRTVGHTSNEKNYKNSEDTDNSTLISYLSSSTDIK